MGFDEYKNQTESSSFGDIEEYKNVNALRYDQKENTEITVKFIKPTFTKRFEFWKAPSEKDQIKSGKSTNFCIVLKNDTGFNHYASLIGNPSQWNPWKDKIVWGNFRGGLYEFDYSDEQDPKTKFKKRDYKHIYNAKYKNFFQSFAFGGAPYDIGDWPTSTPSMRYHAAVMIAGDPIMQEQGVLRWISITHKMFLQLVNFDNNHFSLDDFWFKVKKQGSGKTTAYIITPDNVSSEKLNKLYVVNDFKLPKLELTTQLSSDFYLWKYFKSDFIEGDEILGTHYADKVRAGYEAYLANNPGASLSTEVPVEKLEPQIPEVVANVISSPNVPDLSDDDIPF